MKSADAIAFDYRPSRLLAALCSGMLLLALGSVWYSRLGQYPRWALLLSVLVVTSYALAVLRLLRPRVRQVGWDRDGNWLLLDAGRTQQPATLQGWNTLGPAVLLRLQAAGRRVSLPLLPDNLDRDTRRCLRVRLAQECRPRTLPPSLS
ncbi:hypothetical protein DFR29_12526 [Tahibacter aquaticus]|uniref:Toxin CptA n=1 Tax=Tahibacter aquaticus TaxID=520092 RepID=A0A4R6YJZ1_9GAMM|nr:protein YgfX [Tahibacter aquaticus]TDR37364.1 hypothetical protein DFR29_12526 [Tahibacter aquaticus]